MSTASKTLLLLVALAVAAGGTLYLLQSGPSGGPDLTFEDPQDATDPADQTPPPDRPEALESDEPDPDEGALTSARVSREEVEVDTGLTDAPQGIQGVVLDFNGRPLPGAEIFLMEGQSKNFLEIMQMSRSGVIVPPVARTVTDEYGAFRLGLRRVEEGKTYELRVTHDLHGDKAIPGLTVFEGKWYDQGRIQLERGVVVTGRVTVAGSGGLPIAGAEVSAETVSNFPSINPTPGRENGVTATTDEGGYFRIENVTGGNVTIAAVASGYAREQKQNVQVGPGQENNFVFELPKGLEITGKVIDPDGAGIANALVTALAISSKTPITVETRSDAEGYFALVGLLPGPYEIRANAPGYVSEPIKPIEAGREDLPIELERQGSALLRVIGRNGSPVREYKVVVKRYFADNDMHGNIPDAKFEDVTPGRLSGGYFAYGGLDPDTYVFEIYAKGYAKTYSPSFTITAGGEPPTVEAKMIEGGKLEGVVLDSVTGKPVTGAVVKTLPNFMEDNPFFTMMQGLIPYKVSKRQQKSRGNGRFRFVFLAPGNYQLRISHPDYSDVVVKDLELADGQTLDAGEILMDRGAVVAGVVRVDGMPKGQVKVTISSAPPEQGVNQTGPQQGVSPGSMFSAEAISDEQGNFVIPRRLPPGRYQVRAARQDTGNVFLQVTDFAKTQQDFTVAPAQASVNLDINIPTAAPVSPTGNGR